MAQAKLQKGWTGQQIALLDQAARQAEQQGQPLRTVFEQVAEATGRQPNSVRNFYYAACRQGVLQPSAKRRAPAKAFTPEETRRMLRQIAAARQKGISVRQCTLQMAQGDRTAALRLQNKYRALLRSSPEVVQAAEAGLPPANRPSPLTRAVDSLLQDAPRLPGVDACALLTHLAALFRAAANRQE